MNPVLPCSDIEVGHQSLFRPMSFTFSFTDYWVSISCRCRFVFAKSGEIAFTLSSYWRESWPCILSCEVLVRVGARLLMVQRVM